MDKLPALKCLSQYKKAELMYSRGLETRVFLVSDGAQSWVLKIYTHDSWISREMHNPEAQLHQSLRHHTICPVLAYHLEELDHSFYLVIVEYKMDIDLDAEAKKRLKERRGWTALELESAWSELVSGFAYAQEQRIAHRDIKPANLFLHNGRFMIGDFGSARIYEARYKGEPQLQTFAGTLQFLSPELSSEMQDLKKRGLGVKRIQYDAYRSDVYSLALSLLYLVFPDQAGKLRIHSETQALIDQFPISPALIPLFRSMLALAPSDRPDFLQLQQHLGPLLSIRQPLGPSLSTPQMQQESETLQFINMLSITANHTLSCEQLSELPQPSFDSSDSTSQEAILPARKQLPTIMANYSKTALTMTCVVCGQETPLRQLKCLRHSLCGQKCTSRLEVLRMRGLGKQECFVCSGSTWAEQIKELTESLLPVAHCHHCGSHPLSMHSLLYLLCGGSLHLLCSKSCLKSLYSAYLSDPSRPCPLCRVPFNSSHLRTALLSRSYLDIPAVPGLL